VLGWIFLYQENYSKEKEIWEINVWSRLCLCVVKWRNTSGEEMMYIRFVCCLLLFWVLLVSSAGSLELMSILSARVPICGCK
jgi:hypothetical protein